MKVISYKIFVQNLLAGYGMDDSCGSRYFSLYRRVQTGSGAQPTAYPDHLSNGYRGLFCRGDRSYSFNAEVKNERRFTSIPPYVFMALLLSTRTYLTLHYQLYKLCSFELEDD